ncbi:MAG TPA: tetratricopeptide repeat protein [Pseudobacteroides sp.]|uniref:tetratricopeptide repeat protein n=1 Tax=Pseudobacteroides sp. TaxID=1968840 RepID=UPI002F959B24
MPFNNEFLLSLEEAYHLLEINRIDSAIGKINSLLASAPNNGELLFLKAVCLHQKNSNDEALYLCKDALGHGFEKSRCHHLLAKILYDKNDYINSEEHYLESLAANPHNPDVLADYGELMFKTGHQDKAFKLVNEALRLDPYNGAALTFYIKYNLSTNNKTAHADALQRYMSSSDNDLAKLAKLGISQLISGNSKDAREAIRQAYLMDPTNKDLLELLQELIVDSNPYFKPIQMVEKIGGPKVLWLAFIIILFTLRFLKLDTALIIVAIIYLCYAIYTWTTIPVRKLLEKKIQKS